MKRLSLVVPVALLGALTLAQAETWVRVEKDGSKTYSDRPLPGGQPVVLQSAQTYEGSAATPSTPNQDVPAEQRLVRKIDDFQYSSCSIRPANDETFTNPESVQISVSLNPVLRPNDTVRVTVDGQDIGPNLMSYNMQPVYRGTHTVQVNVTDSLGRVVCSSTSSFHVMRPSVHMPGRN